MSQSSSLQHRMSESQLQQRYIRNDGSHVAVAAEKAMIYGGVRLRSEQHHHHHHQQQQQQNTMPVDCNATDSTSIISMSTTTDRSHGDESLIRTRTNFGDYQYYVPPDMGGTRSKAFVPPHQAAVSQKQPQQHKGRKSTAAAAADTGRIPEPREAALYGDEETTTDQLPFDQVWNQQEFTLDEERKHDEQTLYQHYANLQKTETSTKGLRIETLSDTPFDEACPPDISPKLSAFSVYSIAGSPAHSRASELLYTIESPKVDSQQQPSPFDLFIMPPPRISEPSRLRNARRFNDNTSSSRVMTTDGPKEGRQDPPASDGRDREYISEPSASDETDSVAGRQPQQPVTQPPHISGGANDEEIPSDEDHPTPPVVTKEKPPHASLSESSKSKGAEYLGRNHSTRLSQESPNHLSLATTSSPKVAQDLKSERKLKPPKTSSKKNCVRSPRRRDGGDNDDNDDDDEDDIKSVDSLFDFEDMPASPKTQESKSTLLFDFKEDALPKLSDAFPGHSDWRGRAHAAEHSSESDTSVEGDDVPSTASNKLPDLKSRAQEAFATRKKTTLSKVPKRKPQVSFGATDTIHHFEHFAEEHDYSESEQSEGMSISTYEYAKTVESEVEDAIKDLLMINTLGGCNAGPAGLGLLYSGTKSERCDPVELDSCDAVLISDEEAEDEKPSSFRSLKKQPSGDSDGPPQKSQIQSIHREDVFFEAVLSMVEGGMSAMSIALGLTPDPDVKPEKPDIIPELCLSPKRVDATPKRVGATPKRLDVTPKRVDVTPKRVELTPKRVEATPKRLDATPKRVDAPEIRVPSKELRQSPKRLDALDNRATTRQVMKEDQATSSIDGSEEEMEEEVFESVSEYILPAGENAGSSEKESPVTKRTQPIEEPDHEDDEHFEPEIETVPEEGNGQSLEEDPRLLELAKQAAHCKHEVLGVPYDRTRGVDIGDIKFIVVELVLPLGIIFQEDFCGCWITRVMPDGNADLHGGLEPGDQLAAINGNTSIGMKVDDICAAISEASLRNRVVELTFLRYVGPCRPVAAVGKHAQDEFSSIADEMESASSADLLKPKARRPKGGSDSADESRHFAIRDFAKMPGIRRTESKTRDSPQKRGFGVKKLRIFGRSKKSSR